MRHNLVGAILIALLLTVTGQANAQSVLFDFRSTDGNGVAGIEPNTTFDPGNLGDVITLEAGISVTIVDITAPEYDVSAVATGGLPVQTGNTLSAAAGDAVVTDVSAEDALGVDNPSISNAQNDLIGDGNDSADLNPGETITLTFDQAVVFTSIELESVQATDSFEVLVNGVSMLQTTGDDQFLDSLGGLENFTIPAGTEVTFTADGLLTVENASSFRIETFTVLAAGQEVLFDFRSSGGNGLAGTGESDDFDPSGPEDIVTIDGLNLTIVDITFPEYDVTGALPVLTGNTLSAAAGDGGLTNISPQDALGANNPSIGNGDFDLIGDGDESSDLNPGETLSFTFDQDVVFTSIELESVLADDSFDVLVDGVAVLETTGEDQFIGLGGLAGLTIEAGSEITFAVDGVLETATGGPATSLRIETFTVDTVTTTLLGDVNRDGVVDFLDILPFIGVLSNGLFQAEADTDESGVVDFLDIVPFIAIISAS